MTRVLHKLSLTKVRGMERELIGTVRQFNRTVTHRIGALDDRYLARSRPLGASRVLWEIAPAGTDARTLRSRLELDSGYLSRMLRRLEGEGLITVTHVRISGDLRHADQLMRALDRRASVLRMLRSALDERSVFLWIGDENPQPELRSVSVVGANYGLGHRNLGAVGVLGPLRMDYATAITSVRGAARELSHYFESVYG